MTFFNRIINKILNIINGIDSKLVQTIFNKKHYAIYTGLKKAVQHEFEIEWRKRFIIKDESTAKTSFDRHYTYHPAWAARVLKTINPVVHYDISSILHFGTILSAFIPIKFYDYRPAQVLLDNYNNEFADLLNLPFENNSIESISCMHTIEHIGLGRYGEPVDAFGDVKAMEELIRVVALNGNLLVVVPVGSKNTITYNAHRIYNHNYIINIFKKGGCELNEFVLIPQDPKDGGLIKDPSLELLNEQVYGCGCFWFIKR